MSDFVLNKCEVGDIVHLTKFNNDACDIWAVCTSIQRGYLCHFLLLDAQDAGYEEGDDSENWTMTPQMDTGRIVPEDEVPDHVWAAIARHALLGGANKD